MKDKKTETKPDSVTSIVELKQRREYLEVVRDIVALEHEILYLQNLSQDANISTEEQDRESV